MHGDDGIAPAVIRYQSSNYTFPPDVTLEDLGTPSRDLPAYLAGYDRVMFSAPSLPKPHPAPSAPTHATRSDLRPQRHPRQPSRTHHQRRPHRPRLRPDCAAPWCWVGVVPETLEAVGAGGGRGRASDGGGSESGRKTRGRGVTAAGRRLFAASVTR